MDGRTPEEIRADTYADQNGSYYLARGEESDPRESTSSYSRSHTSRRSRPTGKPLEGPSGRDIGRMEAERDRVENPMTEEAKLAVKRGMGHATFLTEKARLEYESMLRRADGDPKLLAVEMRKLADEGK